MSSIPIMAAKEFFENYPFHVPPAIGEPEVKPQTNLDYKEEIEENGNSRDGEKAKPIS